MVTFALIVLILLLIVISFLLIPIEILIDTRGKQYYAELKGLARAYIEADDAELLRIRVKVPFKEYYFFPIKAWGAPNKSGNGKKRIKGSKSRKRPSFQTLLRLVKSFTIKKWNLDMDTGDCITNAKLYPFFAFMNYRFGGFHINFEGRNQAYLLIRNRPIHIIKSFINL